MMTAIHGRILASVCRFITIVVCRVVLMHYILHNRVYAYNSAKMVILCIMEKYVSIGGDILNCFTLTTEPFYTITFYLVSLTFVYCFLL